MMGDLEDVPAGALVADGRQHVGIAVLLEVARQQGVLLAHLHGEDDGAVVDLAVRSGRLPEEEPERWP